MSLDITEAIKQPLIINAYLEDEKTIIALLSDSIILPFSTSGATVTDTTTHQKIRVTSVDTTQDYQAVIVGNLQQLLGAKSDWNTGDDATRLQKIHANLYQFTGSLPAGQYNYKVAFNDSWDGAFPIDNTTLVVPFGGAKVTFSFVPFDLKTQQPKLYDSINNPRESLPLSSAGLQINLVKIQLDEKPDVTHTLTLDLKNYRQSAVLPRKVLIGEEYTYTGSDLGNSYSNTATKFRLWAPTASDVQLLLYDSENGPPLQQVALERSIKGSWYTEIPGDLANYYYLYQVTVYGSTQIAVDPYAYALAVNAGRGMIVDLTQTNPQDWEHDSYQPLAHPVDAVIYETHVRDFSIDASSGMTNKGKYLAFTERDTRGPDNVSTGVDSLKELGVNYVQLLPVQDFASVDETDPEQYNWGYDPRNYNVPEGAYASSPHGTSRITEFKRCVQSLHASQLGVIMDVVYNHTFASHISDFDKIVPQYYYRTDYAGHYTNGSGVGNELATERPMVQKFVRDSLQYWVKEYHVDGFRFDLMALLGVETMQKVVQDLRALNPHVLLYGEPWTGATSALPWQQLLTKGRQRDMGIGVFNDNIRNSLTGSVFDSKASGFVMGGAGHVDTIKNAVAASINDFTSSPSETINYVTSHDNMTLWDKITASDETLTEDERIQMDELAQAVVFTSQGVPFMQGGEEFLRTKGGNDNSYNAGDEVNHFDWSRKAHYQAVFDYYAGLIYLRANHPAFRMTTAEAIRNNLIFLESPANTVQFLLNGRACSDSWDKIIVIYNPNKIATTFNLPEGSWNVFADLSLVRAHVISEVTGIVVAPAISCLVLYQTI